MTGLRPTMLTLLIFALVGGCASSPSTRVTYADEAFADAAYANFLVIGVAGNYNNRAYFEREIVSGLRTAGANATAFYSLAGSTPFDRDSVLEAVQENGFDAVLVTRVKDRAAQMDIAPGSTAARASPIGGRPIGFFRYDYEEFNEPETLNLSMSVTLSTELFDAADEKMIWAVQTTQSGEKRIGALIEDVADAIVRRISASDLIAP